MFPYNASNYELSLTHTYKKINLSFNLPSFLKIAAAIWIVLANKTSIYLKFIEDLTDLKTGTPNRVRERYLLARGTPTVYFLSKKTLWFFVHTGYSTFSFLYFLFFSFLLVPLLFVLNFLFLNASVKIRITKCWFLPTYVHT